MAQVDELFQSALELQAAGQVDVARQLCEQALELEPRHAPALQLLGVIAASAGDDQLATGLFRRAVEIEPRQPAYFCNLAEALRRQGELTEAIDCYRRAVEIAPAVPVLNELGNTLCQAGSPEAAIGAYQQALQLEPHNPDLHFNIGCMFQKLGQAQAAAGCYWQALHLNPGYRRAWINLAIALAAQKEFAQGQACYERAIELDPGDAMAHFNLGNMHQEQGHLAEAIRCYRHSLALEPGNALTLYNLGSALRERQQLAEAADCLREVTLLRPDFGAAYSNLGVALQDMGKLAQAEAALRDALEIEPEQPTFHFNLGTILKDQGRPQEAIASYTRSVELDPANAQALCARGAALLQMGRFREGWLDYEHRLRCPQFAPRLFAQPSWDGSPLEDRTLLVHCEQGLGDTMQFIRYVKRYLADAESLVIAVQPALIPLLAQSGFRSLVSKFEPLPPFDVCVQLLSLPRVFETDLNNVPCDVPYLSATAEAASTWRDKLTPIVGRRIGIAWQGRVDYPADRLRSLPLASFEPLARLRDVRLISLQAGAGTEQLAQVRDRFDVIDVGPTLDAGGAFLDTAAVMKNLDLVITSDTSIAHLAGALGVPVWVALRVGPDWRWMLDRDDSPWYPSMRLFRQRRIGDWHEVFQRMAGELSRAASP